MMLFILLMNIMCRFDALGEHDVLIGKHSVLI